MQKCISKEVATKGSKVCNPNNISEIYGNENYFYSPSRNNKVELKATEISNTHIILQVRLIPNGLRYQDKGSIVKVCFNPIVGI